MPNSSGERVILPPAEFSKKARIKSMDQYRALHDRSVSNPDGFWAEQAERITWAHKWKTVSKWDFHTARRNKAALIWEGDSPDESRTLTYADVYRETCKFANALRILWINTGDT